MEAHIRPQRQIVRCVSVIEVRLGHIFGLTGLTFAQNFLKGILGRHLQPLKPNFLCLFINKLHFDGVYSHTNRFFSWITI